MNERNVAEIERCIWLAVVSPFMTPREIAEGLAARGVLAPGALTVQQANGIIAGDELMAVALERIAKGETNGV